MKTLHGIPNCDTVKKARAWLTAHGVQHTFHDFKKAGVTREMLDSWCAQVGWETVLNRKGTAWRALPDAVKASVTSQKSAVAVMLEHTSCIKRPVVVDGTKVTVGFDAAAWEKALGPG